MASLTEIAGHSNPPRGSANRKGQEPAATDSRREHTTQWAREQYVMIPRGLLADRELCFSRKLVLTYCQFRTNTGNRAVDRWLVRQLLQCDRSTAWHVLHDLRRDGWIDADGRLLRKLPTAHKGKEKDGALRVEFGAVHDHGVTDAVFLAQLAEMPPKEAQTNEDGDRAPAGMLASMLGVCRDTVRAVLLRLELGDTTRVRLRERRGEACKRFGLIVVKRTPNLATRVYLPTELIERLKVHEPTEAEIKKAQQWARIHARNLEEHARLERALRKRPPD